jgi:hypothetical protein
MIQSAKHKGSVRSRMSIAMSLFKILSFVRSEKLAPDEGRFSEEVAML